MASVPAAPLRRLKGETHERPVRVLHVNDRAIPRDVDEQTLRDGGFEVISVATGAAALRAAREDVDVVLLDVQLPDVDGIEICRRLKADPVTANLVVLLTSATFVGAKSKVAGLDSGADGYLVQPYEPAELFATLRSLLRARAAERRAQALAAELRAAMDVRDELLAMLGHELRNPIGTITTALHMLEQRTEPEARERYQRMLGRQVRSLTRIVDDLLDVARLTRGKISLARDPVDLRDVVERCVQALADELETARHAVELSLPPGPVVVIGDVVRLEQIVSNLVTNAIKYTPRGGHVRIAITGDGAIARLEVADDGIGMDAATRARVFDVFVQGKQTIDRSRGGLGLGLSVVRQLVELHGGSAAAYSDGEGQGSRFVVELPAAPAETTLAAPVIDEVRPGATVHVLVIEDNEDARTTLVEALRELGHQVDVAADGVAGLEAALKARPEVVLVDIGLPRLDGYQVARGIRARADGAAPRLIAMTGYGQPEDRERALHAGFDLHLVKPVSLAALQRLLTALAPGYGS